MLLNVGEPDLKWRLGQIRYQQVWEERVHGSQTLRSELNPGDNRKSVNLRNRISEKLPFELREGELDGEVWRKGATRCEIRHVSPSKEGGDLK